MITLKYKITFLSYWAVGSGKGGGLSADNLVLKENKLPIIPGKTLKGLWREAYNEMKCQDEITLFGHVIKTEDNNENNKIGILRFDSARLKEVVRNNISSEMANELYHKRTMTALDPNKQAVEHSLRKIEVCIPLTLEAEIGNISDEKVKENLKKAMKAIRFIGEKRYRGLGRCKIELNP